MLIANKYGIFKYLFMYINNKQVCRFIWRKLSTISYHFNSQLSIEWVAYLAVIIFNCFVYTWLSINNCANEQTIRLNVQIFIMRFLVDFSYFK